MNMLSFTFLGFCTGIFFLCWLLPPAARRYVLLLANLTFALAFGARSLAALLYVFAVCAVAGVVLSKKQRTVVFTLFFILCLLPLVFTKLLQPMDGWLALRLQGIFPILGRWATPVGVSFYTVRGLLYLWRVKKQNAAFSPLFLFLYLSFFPQLVSGPIQPPDDLGDQLRHPPPFDTSLAFVGAGRILYGMAMKLMVADFFARFQPELSALLYANSLSVVVAVLCYSVQLYCDFAGYSQIALGVGNLLGFHCGENFQSPYLSRSVSGFWRRWHISLSRALREIIYIPLGGSRAGPARWVVATFATFLASGLWHGTGVVFLIWGGWHALCIVVGRATKPWRQKLHRLLRLREDSLVLRLWQTLFTFVLVTIGWLPFKVGSGWGGSVQILSTILSLLNRTPNFSPGNVFDSLALLGFDAGSLLFALVLLALTLVMDVLIRADGFGVWFAGRAGWQQAVFAALCLVGVLFFAQVGGGSFLYFAF